MAIFPTQMEFIMTISDKAKSVIDMIFEQHRQMMGNSTPRQIAAGAAKAAESAFKQVPHPDAPAVIAELKSGSCDWYIAGKMGAY